LARSNLSLDKTLTSAQRNLITRQRSLSSDQNTLASCSAVADKEFALKQAQLNIDSANYALSNIQEVKEAQDHVDAAQLALETAMANMKLAGLTVTLPGKNISMVRADSRNSSQC